MDQKRKTIVAEAKQMLDEQGIGSTMPGYGEVLAATITAVAADRNVWVQRDGFKMVATAIEAITTGTRH